MIQTPHSLALSFQLLAVEPIVKTSSVVTLRVALSIIEVSPALQRGGAVLPRVIEVERAVAIVPAALVVVTLPVTDLVVLCFLALRDVTADLHLRRHRDGVAEPSREVVIQDETLEAIEVFGADTVVERRLRRVFTRAAVVAGVGITGAVGGILALRPSEGGCAQTLGTVVAGVTGASIAAVEAAADLGVIFTCGAGKSLY